jgi:uncharacterized SAM-binding protein YcdF (DUF218 family)
MDYWFSFKKLLSIYLNPVTITLELLFFGVVLIGFASRRPRKPSGPRWAKARALLGDLGVYLVVAGILTLFGASIDPVAHALTLRLEGRYPPLEERDGKPFVPGAPPRAIVILAGGHLNVEGKPVLSRLSRHGLARVIGGVDLWKAFPEARFIVTGHPDETSAMRGIAERLGVPADRIVEESESRDTKDHPRKLAPLLGGERFLLVTSATHLPRAMALFRAAGLDPVPAPVDFLVWPASADYDPYRPGSLIPRVFNLELTGTALHELGGIAWSEWRGELDAPEESESANAPVAGNP